MYSRVQFIYNTPTSSLINPWQHWQKIQLIKQHFQFLVIEMAYLWKPNYMSIWIVLFEVIWDRSHSYLESWESIYIWFFWSHSYFAHSCFLYNFICSGVCPLVSTAQYILGLNAMILLKDQSMLLTIWINTLTCFDSSYQVCNIIHSCFVILCLSGCPNFLHLIIRGGF